MLMPMNPENQNPTDSDTSSYVSNPPGSNVPTEGSQSGSNIVTGVESPQSFSQMQASNKRPRTRTILITAMCFLFIGGLVAAGLYYLSSNKNGSDQTPRQAQPAEAGKAEDQPKSTDNALLEKQTADWVSFTNTKGGYSLKYPKSWKIAGCGESPQSSVMVLLSNRPEYLGICPNFGEEKPRQIQIGFVFRDTANPIKLVPGEEATDVIIDGVPAKKIVTTFDKNNEPLTVKRINYRIYTNGTSFTMSYNIYRDPKTGKNIDDNLADFTTMVEKTVTFD